MNGLPIIKRPEYVLRPRQLWRRLRRDAILARNQVRLAWELPIEVALPSHVGTDIRNLGIYDRVVAEAICRLLDDGEQAFDIGANIGQNVSLMALMAGKRGRAVAFEPGPRAWSILSRNLEAWSQYDLAPIAAVQKAVSSRIGTARLHEYVDIGQCSLEDHPPGERTPLEGSGVEIELTTLDSFVPSGADVGLIKIDVEGHELSVLEGARRLLEQKRIRDIVFEDFPEQPSPVTLCLQAAGYVVFWLATTWSKPVLGTLKERASSVIEVPNFLGTLDPDRALARFQSTGWRCLRVRAHLKSK